MRIGIDSYSYHRLLGEVRPGETPPGRRFGHGSLEVVDAARRLGADAVSLETAFLPAPGDVDAGALLRAAGAMDVIIAWGHPDGLRWGEDAAALEDLLAWIRLAPRLRCRLVRLVVAGPRLPRDGDARRLERAAAAVARAVQEARRHGVALALENHADLTAAELAELARGCPGLGVCLDTANARRMGDDPVAAARLLAPYVRMVHLKDCAADDGGDPVAGPASVPYGDGVIDVGGVLDALGERVDDLAVCVELAQIPPDGDEHELVAQGIRWLRAWRDNRARGDRPWASSASA